MSIGKEQLRRTRHEGVSRKMANLEFIKLTDIWRFKLKIMDKNSRYLQKEIVTMDVASNLFTSLDNFFVNLRNTFP